MSLTQEEREQIRQAAIARRSWTPNDYALLFCQNNVNRWKSNLTECLITNPEWIQAAQSQLALAKADLAHFQEVVEAERQATNAQHFAQAHAA